MATKALSGKQKAFVEHYIVTLNATEAARRALYKGSDSTLRVVGHENLAKPNIKSAIADRLKPLAMSAEEVLARVTEHARTSMADFVSVGDSGDVFLDLKKANDLGRLGAIKKLTETTTTRSFGDDAAIETRKVTIELYGADSAHDKLMRYHSLYNDKIKVDWKKELEDAGLSAGDEFEQLVRHIATNIESGTTGASG